MRRSHQGLAQGNFSRQSSLLHRGVGGNRGDYATARLPWMDVVLQSLLDPVLIGRRHQLLQQLDMLHASAKVDVDG